MTPTQHKKALRLLIKALDNDIYWRRHSQLHNSILRSTGRGKKPTKAQIKEDAEVWALRADIEAGRLVLTPKQKGANE